MTDRAHSMKFVYSVDNAFLERWPVFAPSLLVTRGC
jgi:hypothetical protein